MILPQPETSREERLAAKISAVATEEGHDVHLVTLPSDVCDADAVIALPDGDPGNVRFALRIAYNAGIPAVIYSSLRGRLSELVGHSIYAQARNMEQLVMIIRYLDSRESGAGDV